MRENEKTLGEIMDEGNKLIQEEYQIKAEADRLYHYLKTHPNITVEEGKKIGNKLAELARQQDLLHQKQEEFLQSTQPQPQQYNSSFENNNVESDGDLKGVLIGCLAVVAVVGGVGYAVVMYIKDFLTNFFR